MERRMMSALVRMLSEGLTHHRAGRLTEAAALYGQVLTAEPRNADALHLLGVVDCQSGRAQRGAELIRQAIAVDPQREYYGNLARALLTIGQLDEAGSVLRQHFARDGAEQLWLDYAEKLNASGRLND